MVRVGPIGEAWKPKGLRRPGGRWGIPWSCPPAGGSGGQQQPLVMREPPVPYPKQQSNSADVMDYVLSIMQPGMQPTFQYRVYKLLAQGVPRGLSRHDYAVPCICTCGR